MQRSTYRLTLPYSRGIPLLVVFGVLHWLVSQSLFLARLDVYDRDDDIVTSVSSCRYTLIATIISLILVAICIITILAISLENVNLVRPM